MVPPFPSFRPRLEPGLGNASRRTGCEGHPSSDGETGPTPAGAGGLGAQSLEGLRGKAVSLHASTPCNRELEAGKKDQCCSGQPPNSPARTPCCRGSVLGPRGSVRPGPAAACEGDPKFPRLGLYGLGTFLGPSGETLSPSGSWYILGLHQAPRKATPGPAPMQVVSSLCLPALPTLHLRPCSLPLRSRLAHPPAQMHFWADRP